MLCLKAHQDTSFVQCELESAVCEEDFKEAARLKAILNEATVKDPVSEVFTELTVHEHHFFLFCRLPLADPGSLVLSLQSIHISLFSPVLHLLTLKIYHLLCRKLSVLKTMKKHND